MAMIVHAHSDLPARKMLFGGSGNGFMAKSIQFRGKAAHAGVSPHEGINALNAACLSMINIHVQRETFRDEDSIRVHPIITKGGDVVNVVPPTCAWKPMCGQARRGHYGCQQKVTAIRAGADAGRGRTIRNIPGYLPLIQNLDLTSLARQNATSLAGEEGVGEGGFMGGSTDVGDLAHLIPTIQPYAGGIQGLLHSSEFNVRDYDTAVSCPAKVVAMSAIDLLYGMLAGRPGAIKTQNRL
jgi:metal-dependent amidase/aminoacylase/carboxypeptidase family protein